jgi:hypothetical protein
MKDGVSRYRAPAMFGSVLPHCGSYGDGGRRSFDVALVPAGCRGPARMPPKGAGSMAGQPPAGIMKSIKCDELLARS